MKKGYFGALSLNYFSASRAIARATQLVIFYETCNQHNLDQDSNAKHMM